MPTLSRSLARIVALSCVELANEVARSEPLNVTTDVGVKLVPLTVSVKPASP